MGGRDGCGGSRDAGSAQGGRTCSRGCAQRGGKGGQRGEAPRARGYDGAQARLLVPLKATRRVRAALEEQRSPRGNKGSSAQKRLAHVIHLRPAADNVV